MIFSIICQIRNKIKDVKTISFLCRNAEKFSLQEGEENPGAEHFLLAAMELKDGTAKSVMSKFKVDTPQIVTAIRKQHEKALHEVGIDSKHFTRENVSITQKKIALYKAQPSGQELMAIVFKSNQIKTNPLVGVHVLDAALSFEHGIIMRIMKELGVHHRDLKVEIERELSIRQAA